MSDILFPPWLNVARLNWRYVDSTGQSRNPYIGALKTASLGGDRLACSLDLTPTARGTPVDRAAVMNFVMGLRGRQNRVWLCDPSYKPRGSFPANELLSNNTFASTTGWTVSQPTINSQSASDNRLRSSMLSAPGGSADTVRTSSAVAVTQYAPHILRHMVQTGRGSFAQHRQIIRNSGGTALKFGSTVSLDGLRTTSYVPDVSSVLCAINDIGAADGRIAGDYFDCSWASLTRGLQVDNSPNALTYADQFGNAAWIKTGCSVTDNTSTASDGATTMDSLIENSAAGNHFTYQDTTKTATTEDWCAHVEAKANSRSWITLIVGDTGANIAYAYFNVSTGVVGISAVSGTAANVRAYVVSRGAGIYACYVVASLPSTVTTVRCRIYLATGDGVNAYTGDGVSGLYIFRGGVAKSSMPHRVPATTTTGTTGTPQTGPNLYVKGLPPSTSGLLLPGDMVQVGNQLNFVEASLDSDAAGLGYLQCVLPWRYSPADNDPVIVNMPMGRFAFAGNAAEFRVEPGLITNATLDFEEAA